ncbi:MAG TPA: orotate phosphoribosyltransferase [Nevskiaceae bacterium]|nr:orotate phosphoribosyltransferase [Nevskiaceae bacterium]
MQPHQTDFLELALEHEVLRFGSFTLKSGRTSPYFFNLGRISSGAAMARLARAYAAALRASGVGCDMLFGPAYKGIPLVAAVACALAADGVDLPYAYNRKEAKDHGEGGLLVGAAPRGRVVIVDDVLTAGTALREAIGLLRDAGATPVAALIALDRQEVGPNGRSAVAELEAEAGLRVIPLVTVGDVMTFLAPRPEHAATLSAMRDYQSRYGVNSGA